MSLPRIYSIDAVRGAHNEVPIALDETKAHLHIDFSDDDTYITSLIDQCIAAVEGNCAISIYQKDVTILCDADDEFELPIGPVTSFTKASIKTDVNTYTDQVLNKDYSIDADLLYKRFLPFSNSVASSSNPFYNPPVSGSRYKLYYSVGYGVTIPNDLKLAVLNEIAFRYENRGDSVNRYAQQNVGLSEGADALALSFRRLLWL